MEKKEKKWITFLSAILKFSKEIISGILKKLIYRFQMNDKRRESTRVLLLLKFYGQTFSNSIF
jgi:hypothetical protein